MGEQRTGSKDRLAFTKSDRIGLTALLFLVNGSAIVGWVVGPIPVSYTHLDVYKRQLSISPARRVRPARCRWALWWSTRLAR